MNSTLDIPPLEVPLKVDRSKLMTINNYAKSIGVDRTTVYYWIKEGKIKHVEIDGVFFIEKK